MESVMNNKKNVYEQYKEIEIKTASPGKLIVIMYDGAIRFLKLAKEAIDEKNIEKAHNNIVKAQDIIMELLLSLNMEAGEIAVKLQSLYIFMNKLLMEANIKKEKEPIDRVLKMLTELREVWNEVAKKSENNSEFTPDEKRLVNIVL
jgi:flagellar protein FliS